MKILTQNLRCFLLCLLVGVGSAAWAADTWNASDDYSYGAISTPVTIGSSQAVFAKGTGSTLPQYEKNKGDECAHMNEGNTLTITSSSNIINTITITFGKNTSDNLSVNETRVSKYTSPTWNGLSNKVVINCNSSTYIKSITITYYATNASEITPITTIPDVETLIQFCDQVNGGVDFSKVDEVKLIANLDMSEITTDIDPNSNSSNTWTASIGTEDNPFTGTFNGQGHTISNLKCYYPSIANTKFEKYSLNGLFGYVTGGTIKDLNLTGVDLLNAGTHTDMTSDDTEVYTYGFGGLVGLATDVTIENCDLSGLVQYSRSNNVGAIVGLLTGNSSVSGCDVNSETLNGHRATGGIVGGIQVGSGKTVTITDCSIENEFAGNSCTGGIVGYVYSASDGSTTISSCFNKASVSANGDYCGGIVGYADIEGITNANASVNNCTAIKIESCYNAGNISASSYSYIGGIIGYNEATITNCYNQGRVIGLNYAGGIIGLSATPAYSYVYNAGGLTGDSRGGIIGSGWGSQPGHCYYQSNVPNGVNGGGITSDGRVLSNQIPDVDMNFTKLALSDMQGWKLSSDAIDKLGDGKDLGTGSGDTRKWIFVRSNLPILTGVRGQSVNIPGAPGKHNESSSSTYDYAYASFYSDMTFHCSQAFTGVYYSAASRSEFKVRFVQVPQGIMYGGVDSNGKRKGYTLFQNYNGPNPVFSLEYLPNADATSSAAVSLKDGNIFYGTHSYTTSGDMKVSDGRLYSLSLIDNVAAYRPFTGGYLGGNKSYVIYNYAEAAQSTGTELTSAPTENQVKPAAIFLSNLFVEPEAFLLGDVDVDGAVTITDVVKMVSVVLNENADDVIMMHGDVNGDGDLDVADVVAIVNKVLGMENDVKARKANSASNGGDEASLELNDGVVDFLLNNSSAFCAFQFYMSAEDGLDCKNIILSARAKGHTVSMNKLSDGRYKVMCYSGVNKSFEGSEGELFNILTSGASGKLTLEDLFFVTPGASKVKFGNMDIDVVPTGISGIDADEKANTIFDLSGRRVQKVQKGVYIVNGKKVIL